MNHIIITSILELLIFIIGINNAYLVWLDVICGRFTLLTVFHILMSVICVTRFVAVTTGCCSDGK
jgi:hypothetical protein